MPGTEEIKGVLVILIYLFKVYLKIMIGKIACHQAISS